MITYHISAIQRKAARLGQDYLDDCRALADTWDEAADQATYTPAALAELKATWLTTTSHAQIKATCNKCGGLSND